ncbi:AfsR/SARP family transcriptional regulator [Terrabacter sp. RAF57]|uniref:AfsR/SARP family transcriptional regulator n=1 Tax=Terrabacter sp. RAF57 TaxID=3233063 RepID=UPI003F94DD1D
MSSLITSPPPSTEQPVGCQMLCLVGGPYVVRGGHRLNVPEGSKRLLAFIALHGGRVDRRQAAGTLWPEGSDERAAGNLRSAVWRLKSGGIDILLTDKQTLALRPGTQTDVNALCEWAGRLADGCSSIADLRILAWDPEAADILPGWYDEWVICERERIRQRLLHGLEAVVRELINIGRVGDAVEAAMNVVRFEPLRESAQRALIEAHLAEHNRIEARRAFERYSRLLAEEMGLMPSTELADLVTLPVTSL